MDLLSLILVVLALAGGLALVARRDSSAVRERARPGAEASDPAPPPPAASGRTLYHRVPEGWPPFTSETSSGLLRIDAILAMAQYAGEGAEYTCTADDLLVRKLTDDGVAFLVHAVFTHRDTGVRHGALFCYSEEEASYFPYCARRLEAEEGWGETLYFGVVPFAELPTGDEVPVPETITFADLFVFDEEYAPADKLYALWQRQRDELTLPHGRLFGLLNEVYEALDGYEPHVASFLLSDWRKQEFEGFSRLPEETVFFPMRGPEQRDVVVAVSREQGILLLTPHDAPANYRARLYRQFRDIARLMVARLREADVEPFDYAGAESPRAWWRKFAAATQRYPYIDYLNGWSPGETRPETTVPALPYDPEEPDPEQLVPRVVFAPDGLEITGDGPDPPVRHLAGPLHVLYAFDRVDHYQYLTRAHLEKMPAELIDGIEERALANLLGRLGENIGVEFAQDQSIARLRVDPDHLAATLLADHLWQAIDEHMGGDVAVVVPNPFTLAIGKWTVPEARAYLERVCADTEAANAKLYWGDTFYHYVGGELGWRVGA